MNYSNTVLGFYLIHLCTNCTRVGFQLGLLVTSAYPSYASMREFIYSRPDAYSIHITSVGSPDVVGSGYGVKIGGISQELHSQKFTAPRGNVEVLTMLEAHNLWGSSNQNAKDVPHTTML